MWIFDREFTRIPHKRSDHVSLLYGTDQKLTPSSAARTYDQNPRQGSSSWRNRDFGHRCETAACQADGECKRVNNEKKQERHCCSLKTPKFAASISDTGTLLQPAKAGGTSHRGRRQGLLETLDRRN